MQLSKKAWSVRDNDKDRGLAELHAGYGNPVAIVAEADDHLRAQIAQTLRDEGFRILQASSGWQLLDHIGRRMLTRGGYPLDFVISDVQTTGVTGLDVLAGIRENNWATPVVLTTAVDDPQLRAEARRLGALAVLDKPFDVGALRALARPWARVA